MPTGLLSPCDDGKLFILLIHNFITAHNQLEKDANTLCILMRTKLIQKERIQHADSSSGSGTATFTYM